MSKPTPSAPAEDKYKNKRQKFYTEPEVIEAFDELCRIEGKSRSEVITMLVKARIRQKAPKLRKAGYRIPQEAMTK